MIPRNNGLLDDTGSPAICRYRSSMATGQVTLPDLDTTTWFPCLSWSVLLDHILIFSNSLLKTKSQALNWDNSSNLRKADKPSKHMLTIRMSDSVAAGPANLWTNFPSVSTVTGSFLTAGLATKRWTPATNACTVISGCASAHLRHFSYAYRYFVVVESAFPLRITPGNFAARPFSSGFCRSFRGFQAGESYAQQLPLNN